MSPAALPPLSFGACEAPSLTWLNYPSDRHLKGGNFTFLDGHGEHWQWKDPKIYTGTSQTALPGGDTADLQRVQRAIPPEL